MRWHQICYSLRIIWMNDYDYPIPGWSTWQSPHTVTRHTVTSQSPLSVMTQRQPGARVGALAHTVCVFVRCYWLCSLHVVYTCVIAGEGEYVSVCLIVCCLSNHLSAYEQSRTSVFVYTPTLWQSPAMRTEGAATLVLWSSGGSGRPPPTHPSAPPPTAPTTHPPRYPQHPPPTHPSRQP